MKRFLVQSSENAEVMKAAKKRKYDDDYIKYGFIASEKDDSIPKCILCLNTLANESMVPSKLERHLQQKHPEVKDKPKDYFERLKENSVNQARKLKAFTTLPDKAQMVSYKIAQMLAKVIAAEIMIGPEAAEKFKKIPLSHQTISRRIGDMSEDIHGQLKNHFSGNAENFVKLWALQIDESTDISNKAQLLAFLRIVKDGKIVEEYFFCDDLKQTTTGKDIFEMVDSKVALNGMSWKFCVSICMDGAPSMQGHKKGFAAYVLEQNSAIKVNHCMIHREMLMSKNLPEKLKTTMNDVVKIVNYIKSSALRFLKHFANQWNQTTNAFLIILKCAGYPREKFLQDSLH